jgi:hypothetical protein
MQTAEIDAVLVEWGNRVFNSGPVRKRIRRGMTGLRLLEPHAMLADAASRRMDASEVRRKMQSLVKRTPQVMVRVSGGGKSIRHIKAHLDYISRNGQIPLEDQNGDKLSGKADVDALRDEWQFGGIATDDGATSKQAFNVILSMPAGTSELAVMRAARDFAAGEFHNFQYVMALHTQDTDPDASPSPNPHVHLCVKATGLDGTRLNPHKGDLRRWRESFAERLREHGVVCEASRRVQRLQPKRGERQSVRHKKARGELLTRTGTGSPDRNRASKSREVESEVLAGYQKLAMALARSDDVDDRKLALGLVARISNPEKPAARGHDESRDR